MKNLFVLIRTPQYMGATQLSGDVIRQMKIVPDNISIFL